MATRLKGYALRGSADIARQGFQLWNAWGSTRANDDIKEITVSGQKLSHSISDFQPATTYAYRTFVEIADGKTVYGDEKQFTTEVVTAIEDAVEDRQEATIVGYYTLQGHPISALQKGVNIIRYSDGSARKMLVR